MKLGLSLAALALIGAAALASQSALAESQEPPHVLATPKSSFMNSQAPKSRSFKVEAKSGDAGQVIAPQAPASDGK